MTIKPTKGCIAYSAIYWILAGGFFAFFYFALGNLPFGIAVAAVILLPAIRWSIAACRTLVMDKNGCVVKLLFFKKTYKWEDLKTIQLENYQSSFWPEATPYESAVVFSRRKDFRKRARLMPLTYASVCLNPFSFFWVYFKPSEELKKSLPLPKIYEVEAEAFMKQMTEWSICVSEAVYEKELEDGKDKNDELVIKPTVDCIAVMALYFFCSPLAFLFLYLVTGSWIVGLIAAAIVALLASRWSFAACRTLVMDKNGCVVKLLCFKKKYSWNELKTVRVERLDGCWPDGTPYQKGVIFSKRKDFRKNPWLKPLPYSSKWGNQFSFFWVYFEPTAELRKRFPYPKIYEVKEASFINKLTEWGVDITY